MGEESTANGKKTPSPSVVFRWGGPGWGSLALRFIIRKLGLEWGTGLKNCLQDRLEIAMDFVIRKSLNTIPAFFQPSSPPSVIVGLVGVTISIEFNNKLFLSADKINNERANGMLATKA